MPPSLRWKFKEAVKFTPAYQTVIQVTAVTKLKHSLIEMFKRGAYETSESFKKNIKKKWKELNDNLWSILAAQKELKKNHNSYFCKPQETYKNTTCSIVLCSWVVCQMGPRQITLSKK